MSSCENEIFGSDPVNIRWSIVRGDTSTLRVDFLDNDETTYIDTDGWTYVASAYDKKTDIIDELEVEAFEGYVIITAPADITALWGTTYGGVVAELNFDLEVTLDDADSTVWTPVIGSISVIGDVAGGL
jgi:hypothetical protein